MYWVQVEEVQSALVGAQERAQSNRQEQERAQALVSQLTNQAQVCYNV